MEDAELVVAARSGDRAAFAAIYDRYADRIHDFCTSTLRDRAEAADVMQETFLVAFERLGQLREPARLKPWLYAIAHHASLKRVRGRDRLDSEREMDDVISGSASPEDEATQAELAQFVWQAAAGLGERDRALLDLHLRQGLEGKDLAAAVGVAPSHVYVMLNRLKAQVERSLGALLVARTGRRDCTDLAGMLTGWDGRLTPELRTKVGRHVDRCDVCGKRRKAVLNPLALLAAVPIIPAPVGLREVVMHKVRLTAATSDAPSDASGAGSGWAFDHDGFPRQVAGGRRRRARELAIAGIAAAIVLLGGITVLQVAADHAQPGAPVAVLGTNTTVVPATTTTTTTVLEQAAQTTVAPPQAPAATTPVPPGRVTTTTSARSASTTSQPVVIGAVSATPPTVFTGKCLLAAGPVNSTSAVSATVAAGAVPIKSVTLGWQQKGGAAGSLTMSSNGPTWSATLGPFAQPGTVQWSVTAADASGTTAMSQPQSLTVQAC